MSASQFVGTADFGDLVVRVAPKAGIHRLLELLCSTLELISWNPRDVAWAESNDLLTTVAGTFVLHAQRALANGVLQGYRTEEDSLTAVRGRIDLGRQISQHPGMPLPIAVTYDDYTVDVLENQLLAGAGRVLLRLPGLPARMRAQLRRLEILLLGAIPTRPSHDPPAVTWTRLNARYRLGVILARLILRSSALEFEGLGMTTGSGFRVDMNRVFEDVVGKGMQDAVRGSGSRVVLQSSDHLDHDRRIPIRPDIVVRQDEHVVAVADVKYKRPSLVGISTSDVYQALAYATRHRVHAATIIYPEPAPHDHVRVGDVTVFFESLDLSEPAAVRSRNIQELTHRILERSAAGVTPSA
ncbi:hypothetical protein [Microbacterium sp. NPDC077184]|uniref:McrC family protein n=1 Tax=Microbacterium sp. NPDC077184 TaxID=3154764 RepID=UPI003443E91C